MGESTARVRYEDAEPFLHTGKQSKHYQITSHKNGATQKVFEKLFTTTEAAWWKIKSHQAVQETFANTI